MSTLIALRWLSISLSHISFSKGLISSYWSTQPYTLTQFKKKAHETNSSIPKKRPAASQATKVDRKQLVQEIKSSQISTAPPSGLVWSDTEAIVNVFHSEPATVFAEVKWKNGNRNTYIPTRIIKKYCPQQVSTVLTNITLSCNWCIITISSLSFTRAKSSFTFLLDCALDSNFYSFRSKQSALNLFFIFNTL